MGQAPVHSEWPISLKHSQRFSVLKVEIVILQWESEGSCKPKHLQHSETKFTPFKTVLPFTFIAENLPENSKVSYKSRNGTDLHLC